MKNPNPDQGKRYEVPVWNQDVKLYEDYQVGEVDRSLRRTISEGEVMLFNSLVLDMHPYVGDDIWAREHGLFKKLLVPGAMEFSYGYDKLRFIKPTFIGDTIYGMRTLLEKTPKYENMGLFKVSYEIFRADNEELVLYTEHLQTVLYRTSQAENIKAEGKE